MPTSTSPSTCQRSSVNSASRWTTSWFSGSARRCSLRTSYACRWPRRLHRLWRLCNRAVGAFNVEGAVDISIDYYHSDQVGLPALAGELGATYAIPIIYVPVLMITHFAAFYLLVRPQPYAARALAGNAAAS